ncbi:bifunctional diaminohydroxyphosphoribosylaminopyrimidine deaminase/5-amino-6-(5-phosphoribosylamino)uracil reductase RibD [Formicincola oecophyllae]|uniref:Riboflavin biosynthesis protein RibD n=1 Tax=Formicincola oecophyllae TaxID=2558361 RepID=A0A4Y6U963_9PROT|nr:bifunctional diaminohydroxyphosphoribosylaminopyrimidine deaminase/5-amino-6-(5-phosphoribosylamino)uracil reductase RibD [Formicincola oecophyllae]QDH13550.1 bifunctional diaminohydroxyphosphoribosylaminopyrimidine deaminase/5-amino-6-(5-phosphoribosylamino)uracil reductase RibD [Formicincola oecophyllae]
MTSRKIFPDKLPEQALRTGITKALDAACLHMGAVSPNPAVGCALFDEDGTVLAVGAHKKAGAPHAEVMAVQQARARHVLERVHSAFVTLEPCAHFGRTPPCADLLASLHLKDLWLGQADPNAQASGGALKLRDGGVAVHFLGAMPDFEREAAACRALAAPFCHRQRTGKAWLTVKQALNAQGSMLPPPGQKTFTSPEALKLAHVLRRTTDAVVTGIGTVLADNPTFTVRHVDDVSPRPNRPLLVFDRQGRLPEHWRQARQAEGFVVERCTSVAEMQAILAKHHANHALVEGGPALLAMLKRENAWDDWLSVEQTPAPQGLAERVTAKVNAAHGTRYGQGPAALVAARLALFSPSYLHNQAGQD